eukprot:gb/GFBE01082917.1/.p1 GENE.gb/GFBE01082917.1/~~gb/GFBE01082917.1/.p1  ORF type:complete len:209 (+),score=32.60 gb/GFBE01082917.1/:1-627(+)
MSAEASAEEADAVLQQALTTTKFWEAQFGPSSTCTACGASLTDTAICHPGNRSRPPLAPKELAGTFGDAFYGPVLSLRAAADDALEASLGPVNAVLDFGPSQTVIEEACSSIAQHMPSAERGSVGEQVGNCLMIEFRVPSEIAAAGISESNRTIAFPWGCGIVPLPTAMPIYVILSRRSSAVWAWLPTADVVLPRLEASSPYSAQLLV